MNQETRKRNNASKVTKFTPMKLELLRTSKPEINLSLLETRNAASKNQRIVLKEELILKMGLQGVANILNLVVSNFGDVSLFDFRNLDLNDRTIYLRFYSFRASKNFFMNFRNFDGIESCVYLQEFCCYGYSDKALFYTNRGFDQTHIFNVLTTFGEIRKFKKISMKKIVVKFDDDRSLVKLKQAKMTEMRKKADLLEDLEDDFVWIIKSCVIFSKENSKLLYFHYTNPFKLRQAGKSEKENFGNLSHQGSKENIPGGPYQSGRFGQLNNWSPNIPKMGQNGLSRPLKDHKFDSKFLGVFTQGDKSSQNSLFQGIKSSTPRPRRQEKRKLDFSLNTLNIKKGLENRTTLMIKNVPNAYSQEEMIQRLDLRIKGLYDFFYLPIDFTNNCNLGYAFINLICKEGMLALIEEFDNKKWPLKKSSKICELKFARIQGRNRLINHFKRGNLLKNSDVERIDYIPFVIPNDLLDPQIF